MTAADIAERLHARQTRVGEWRARCPHHEGKSRTSLSIRETPSGRIVLHCFAGCSTADVLRAADLRWSDLFLSDYQLPKVPSHDPRGEIIATEETVDSAIACALAHAVVAPEEELIVHLVRQA